MCQEPRRNSPSVTPLRPSSACITTAWRIQASSVPRSIPAVIRPPSYSARAASKAAGRNRLPTCSARNGGSAPVSLTIVSLMIRHSASQTIRSILLTQHSPDHGALEGGFPDEDQSGLQQRGGAAGWLLPARGRGGSPVA